MYLANISHSQLLEASQPSNINLEVIVNLIKKNIGVNVTKNYKYDLKISDTHQIKNYTAQFS